MHDVVDIESMPNSLRNELKESAYAETEALKKLEANYKNRLYNEDNSIVLELTIPEELKQNLEENPDLLRNMTDTIDNLLSDQLNDKLDIQDPALTNLSNITTEGNVIDGPISTQYLAGLPVNLTLTIEDEGERNKLAQELRDVINSGELSGGAAVSNNQSNSTGLSAEESNSTTANANAEGSVRTALNALAQRKMLGQRQILS